MSTEPPGAHHRFDRLRPIDSGVVCGWRESIPAVITCGDSGGGDDGNDGRGDGMLAERLQCQGRERPAGNGFDNGLVEIQSPGSRTHLEAGRRETVDAQRGSERHADVGE